MAEHDNTAASSGSNLQIEAKGLLFEVRVVLESVGVGLEALIKRPDAIFMREELSVLRKLTTQAAEAVEAFEGLFAAAEGGAI